MKKIIYKQAVLLVFVSYSLQSIFYILGCSVLINKKLDMIEEENDVPYNVVNVAAAVIQDLLPTLHFTSTAIRVR
jgi:predicted neutral ceramidase superfamily lipid hydrolase